jgi:hypothetical protein
VFRFVIQISKGLIRDQSARRWVMFYVVLAASVMLFIGYAVIDAWLRERPLFFLAWWGACAWLTLLSVLLALFDLLMVRARLRRDKRELARRILSGDSKVESENDAG